MQSYDNKTNYDIKNIISILFKRNIDVNTNNDDRYTYTTYMESFEEICQNVNTNHIWSSGAETTVDFVFIL